MVPEFMFEILSITERGVEVAHHSDHRLSLACSLMPILDLEQRVNHLMNMSSVLGEIDLASSEIIVFSHCYACFYDYPLTLKLLI